MVKKKKKYLSHSLQIVTQCFFKFLDCAYALPRIVLSAALGAGDRSVDKTRRNRCPHGAYDLLKGNQ